MAWSKSMIRLSIYLLPALAITTIGCSAPIPEHVTDSPFYFPTDVGATWVYQSGDEETKEVVTEVEKVGESYIVTSAVAKDHKLLPSAKFKVSSEGIFLLSIFRDNGPALNYDPPECWLKLPAMSNTSWTYESNGEQNIRTIGNGERVRVPAGTFDAIPVVTKSKAPNTAREVQNPFMQRQWYARGIGCIKSENGDKISVLKSFSIKKD